MGLKIFDFRDAELKDEIKRLYSASCLIPFLGAGFTVNCKSSRGKVPNGKELSNIIKRTVFDKKSSGITSNDISSLTTLKDSFSLLNQDFLTKEEKKNLLSSLFQDVKLNDKSKNDFLRLDWPHIFTFNIDDAIESHTASYKKIVPNRKVSREFFSANKCIVKIHGDITEFSALDDSSLVFTWKEYTQSLKKNLSILEFVKDRSLNCSFLFIGCSLDSELDIMHLDNDDCLSKSFYIKKGELSFKERINIEEHGIKNVITFEDYDQIYSWFNEILHDVKRTPPVINLRLDTDKIDKEEFLRIITNGGPNYKTIENERTAVVSEMFPTRHETSKLKEVIINNDVILLHGKRISGKTTLLFQIIRDFKEFSFKFWSSSDSYNVSSKEDLKNLENTLFIFDSNSLSPEALNSVLDIVPHRTSRIILVCSSGDVEFYRYKIQYKKTKYYELYLDNKLKPVEVESYNKHLNTIGLPSYKIKETLLHFAFRCYEQFKNELGESELFSKVFDEHSNVILILIAAFEKVDENLITSIYPHFNIESFVKSNQRIFEIEMNNEGCKQIICNIKSWLLKNIQKKLKNEEHPELMITDLIKKLNNSGFTSHANNLIRFDKLNEIYGNTESEKSGSFIKRIYLNVESIYANDPDYSLHYWLQRAKAELITAKCEDDISNGVFFCLKIRTDTSSNKKSTYYSATLVLTQLYAKGYEITTDQKYLLKFIEPCYESLINIDFNKKHIKDMLTQKSVRNVVAQISNSPSFEMLKFKDKISEIVRNVNF